ncbi:MAG: twin-arginine translocation signal domain-containing protein [Planctomycetota bacterium]
MSMLNNTRRDFLKAMGIGAASHSSRGAKQRRNAPTFSFALRMTGPGPTQASPATKS